ncbi:hypothetical protein Rsub_03606 [Raphidocelis subcapitata]|uniref:CBM20 domain-containing protein n=1 Tax=Raphidocelis subcapitata TaxID=307507 RepID=A0A2V0NUG8_9CHLO|nr:hypothetical protein Rsub_03606 [Raphidocelis subcapitata]|eukprot:GBF91286.1 hypothetical protein Rsub_03606 [Raphidocelis subcapitata]
MAGTPPRGGPAAAQAAGTSRTARGPTYTPGAPAVARRAARAVAAPAARGAPSQVPRPQQPARRGARIVRRYREGDGEAPSTAAEAVRPAPEAQQDDLVPVEFILGHRCAFGERFAIVGDCEELGCWDVARARRLEWHASDAGDVWSAVLPLPPNRAIAFKPVVVSDADGSCVAWADDVTGGAGRNLTVTVSEGSEGAAGAHVELLPQTSGERRPYLTARLPPALAAEVVGAAALDAQLRSAAIETAARAGALARPEEFGGPLDLEVEARLDEAAAAMLSASDAADIEAERRARLEARRGGGGGGGGGGRGAAPAGPPRGGDPSVVSPPASAGALEPPPPSPAARAPIEAPPPAPHAEIVTARGEEPVVVDASDLAGAHSVLEVRRGTLEEAKLPPSPPEPAPEPAAGPAAAAVAAAAEPGAGAEEGAAAAAAVTPTPAPEAALAGAATGASERLAVAAEAGAAGAAAVEAGAAAGAEAYEATLRGAGADEAARAAAAYGRILGAADEAAAGGRPASARAAASDATAEGVRGVEEAVRGALQERERAAAAAAAEAEARHEEAAERRRAAAEPGAAAAGEAREGGEGGGEGLLGAAKRLFKKGTHKEGSP